METELAEMVSELTKMANGVKDTLEQMMEELETSVTDTVWRVDGIGEEASRLRHWMERALRAEGLLAIQEAVFGQMGQADDTDYGIVQCSWCERYFDEDTKEYAPTPETPVDSHGICKECLKKQLVELDELDEEGG